MSWVMAAWFRVHDRGVIRYLDSNGLLTEDADSVAKFETQEQAKAFAAEHDSFWMRLLRLDDLDAWRIMHELEPDEEKLV